MTTPINHIRELLAVPVSEPRLVSYGLNMETCTLNLGGEEYYYDLKATTIDGGSHGWKGGILLVRKTDAEAKITEQAALIEKMDIENTSCRVRIGTLNAQLTTQADHIQALGAEAADRESFIKTLADTCTEAERIAIERAGRIEALEAENGVLRAKYEAFSDQQHTIERQRKVIGLCKEAMTWDVGGEPLPTLEVEALAAIAELEKGVA